MKTLVRIVLALALLLVVLIVAAYLAFGALVSKAVGVAGEAALGVPTRLEGASLAASEGRVSLAGLSVSNPPGFSTPHFLSLAFAEAQVALGTLTSEKVRVERIELRGLDVNLERTKSGTNFGAILDALERFEKAAGAEQPSGEPEAKESGKKLVIGELVLRDIRVHAKLAPELGGAADATLTLPETRLTELGGEQGLTLPQLIAKTVEVLLAASVQAGGGVLPSQLLADLKGGLKGLGDSALQRISRDLDGNLKGLGDSLEKGVQKGLDSLGRSLEDLFK